MAVYKKLLKFGIYAAIFVAAYTFGGLAGPLTLGWIADRTTPRLVLSFTLAMSATFVLLILLHSR